MACGVRGRPKLPRVLAHYLSFFSWLNCIYFLLSKGLFAGQLACRKWTFLQAKVRCWHEHDNHVEIATLNRIYKYGKMIMIINPWHVWGQSMHIHVYMWGSRNTLDQGPSPSGARIRLNPPLQATVLNESLLDQRFKDIRRMFIELFQMFPTTYSSLPQSRDF